MVEGITPTSSRQVIITNSLSPAYGDRQYASNYTTQRVQAHKKNSLMSTIVDFSNLVLTALSIACTIAWGILMFRQYKTQQRVERELGSLTNPTGKLEPLEIRFTGIPESPTNFFFNQHTNLTLKETALGSKTLYAEFTDLKPITSSSPQQQADSISTKDLQEQSRLLNLGIKNSVKHFNEKQIAKLIESLMHIDFQGIQSQLRNGTQDSDYRIDSYSTFESLMEKIEAIQNHLLKNHSLKVVGQKLAEVFHDSLKADLQQRYNFSLNSSVSKLVEEASNVYKELTQKLISGPSLKSLSEHLKSSGLEFLMPPESLVLEILADGFPLNSKALMSAANLDGRVNNLRIIVNKIETNQKQPVTT